jgi:AraC-like DNA-binding protein
MLMNLTVSEFFPDGNIPVRVLWRDRQPDYPLHTHEFDELVIVYGGSGEHFRSDECWTIEAGDVFVMHGQTPHGYQQVKDLQLVNIIFDMHGFNNPLSELIRFPAFHALFMLSPRFSGVYGGAMRLSHTELSDVIGMLEQMETEQDTQDPGYRLMLTGLFMQLVAYLTRCYGKKQQDMFKPNAPLIRLAEVIAMMAEKSAYPWTRAELAAKAGMSSSTLTRAFKRFTGDSPIDYLIKLRIKKSCSFLAASDLSISEIAQKCGFADSNYFTRQFNKHTNTTPRQYRKIVS